MVEVDKDTEEQMKRIRRVAKKLGMETIYDQLSLISLVFLNEKESSKRRKKSDWVEYFLEGFYYGARYGSQLNSKIKLPPITMNVETCDLYDE